VLRWRLTTLMVFFATLVLSVYLFMISRRASSRSRTPA
jgi:hypothetical protein